MSRENTSSYCGRSSPLDFRLCGTAESNATLVQLLHPKDPPQLDLLGCIRFGHDALKPDEHDLLEAVAAEYRRAVFYFNDEPPLRICESEGRGDTGCEVERVPPAGLSPRRSTVSRYWSASMRYSCSP
jgi:hypothetical protein